MQHIQKYRQVSYGEALGILLIENFVPFIPGDVANATSYDFPVRFQRLSGFTPARLFEHDTSMVEVAIEAGRALVEEGVRAITGDCGFLAIYQNRIAGELGVPVFLSSLLQLDFLARILEPSTGIGVVTANRSALDRTVLDAVTSVADDRLVVTGLEDKQHFVSAVFHEDGMLDDQIVEREVLEATDEIMDSGKKLGAILLECSLLPPYAAAVQERTGLPVFDYNTMIRFVHSSLVRRRFTGFM